MDLEREHPVVAPGQTYGSITAQISHIVLEQRTPLVWYVGMGFSFLLLSAMLFAVGWLFLRGVGVWGINVPVGWGYAIINFAWWVGIGHAGMLISVVLLIFRQEWRTSINRFAEAMTLFAVAVAALFPLLHLGRPWLFYWMLPYPNSMNLWPQFRSPLIWDMVAVMAHGMVSLLFLYVGLIPDLATFRDRARHPLARRIYGLLAIGWRGSAFHWQRYEATYYMIAVLAIPLVVLVHSIVGLDFAVSIIPGWHEAISPPFFVVGGVLSGFAMLAVLSIPLRGIYSLDEFITLRHLDNMAKVMLVMSLLLAYGYLMELFNGWYSGSLYEQFNIANRFLGPYALLYWVMLGANLLLPQLFWFRRIRLNTILLFFIALMVLVGMWLERFAIVIINLHRDYLPSSWDMYSPTLWDWGLLIGSIGLFFSLLFLFIRFLPLIPIHEMRELVAEGDEV